MFCSEHRILALVSRKRLRFQVANYFVYRSDICFTMEVCLPLQKKILITTRNKLTSYITKTSSHDRNIFVQPSFRNTHYTKQLILVAMRYPIKLVKSTFCGRCKSALSQSSANAINRCQQTQRLKTLPSLDQNMTIKGDTTSLLLSKPWLIVVQLSFDLFVLSAFCLFVSLLFLTQPLHREASMMRCAVLALLTQTLVERGLHLDW